MRGEEPKKNETINVSSDVQARAQSPELARAEPSLSRAESFRQPVAQAWIFLSLSLGPEPWL